MRRSLRYIMGYFDPSRITESTMRNSIRESPPALALWAFASAFDLEARWKKERNPKEGRNEEAVDYEKRMGKAGEERKGMRVSIGRSKEI